MLEKQHTPPESLPNPFEMHPKSTHICEHRSKIDAKINDNYVLDRFGRSRPGRLQDDPWTKVSKPKVYFLAENCARRVDFGTIVDSRSVKKRCKNQCSNRCQKYMEKWCQNGLDMMEKINPKSIGNHWQTEAISEPANHFVSATGRLWQWDYHHMDDPTLP